MSPIDSHVARIRGEQARKENELVSYQASYNKQNASFSGFNKYAYDSGRFYLGSKNASSPHSFKLKSQRSRSHYNNQNQLNHQRIGTLALSMDGIDSTRIS